MKRKQNFLKIILAMLGFAISGQSIGQNCTNQHLPNTTSNNSELCSELFFEYGSDPYFYVNTGNGSKEINASVRQISGTKYVNGSLEVVTNELIHVDRVTTRKCRVLYAESVDNICGRVGQFLITVDVIHDFDGGGVFDVQCGTGNKATYQLIFTVNPDPNPILPPVTSIAEIVCPSLNTKFSIADNIPNQTGAFWYNFNTNTKIASDYFHFAPIEPGEVRLYDISYNRTDEITGRFETVEISDKNWQQRSKNKETCLIESRRIPYKATAIDVNTEVSPRGTVRAICRPGTLEITIPNTALNEYDGVRWYKDAGLTDLVHTGFSFQRFYNTTTTFYITYYKDYGDCEKESLLPGVVNVYVLSDDVNELIRTFNAKLYNNHLEDIFDYRDYENASCQSDEIYFADIAQYETTQLSYFANVGQLNADVDVTGFWESSYVVDGKHVFMQDGETRGATTANLFEINGSEKRVCADHVGYPEKQYGPRNFFYREIYNFKYKVLDQSGTLVDQTEACEVSRSRIQVSTKPLHEGICLPIDAEKVEEVDTEILENCDRTNYRNLCPEDIEVTLGPSEAVAKSLYDGVIPIQLITMRYTWSPSTGLNNPDILNPKTSFNDVPSDINELHKYSLRIDYVDATNTVVDSKNYCEIIYKCGNCGTVDDPIDAAFELTE